MSYAELYSDVRGCGKIGRYLVDQLVEFNSERSFAGYSPERRCLGDSAAVGVVLKPGAAGTPSAQPRQFRSDGSYDESGAHPPIRVYHSIDSRFVIGGLFAKLQAYAEKNESKR